MTDEIKNSELTTERVMQAKIIAAKIVATHGDAYLPLFTRLEEEVERLSKDKEAIERALESAR